MSYYTESNLGLYLTTILVSREVVIPGDSVDR